MLIFALTYLPDCPRLAFFVVLSDEEYLSFSPTPFGKDAGFSFPFSPTAEDCDGDDGWRFGTKDLDSLLHLFQRRLLPVKSLLV